MSDRARKSSEKSTGSSSDKRTNTNSRQSAHQESASEVVPTNVSITSIAEEICFWSSQTKLDNTPLVAGVEVDTRAFGKPRRLFSQIEKETSNGKFKITSLSNKFPIKGIFLNRSEVQHTVTLPNGTPYTFNSGVIHINAGDLELSRRTTNDESRALIQQEATFNITTGEIELRLKQDTAGLLYQSKYKVHELLTPDAQIKLNPFTTEPEKLIQPIKRTKTFFSKLDKRIVNIYSYLNLKANRTPNINFNSTLAELQSKLRELARPMVELESLTVQSSEQKLEIAQYKFVQEVLTNEESLTNYKKDLSRWFENYKSWSNRPDLVSESIENHQYILDFKKVGKTRLSKYMEHLASRTMQYDSRIVVTEDTEIVTDYTQTETAQRTYSQDKQNVSRIQDLLNKATSRNNQVEVARYTAQLKEATAKAKVSVIDRMKRTDTIKSASGFGLYPPYLLSDMLRHGSIFMKTNIIDALALSSENIRTFAGYINGFKSLVFSIVSLYNQLAVHKLANGHLCTRALNDVADTIISVQYCSSLYPQLGWLYTPSAEGVVPTHILPVDIAHPLRFAPCMGAEKSLGILADVKPEFLPKVRDLSLLRVDEPVFGENAFSGDVLDFDIVYANSLKPAGILGGLISMFSEPLGRNFGSLLEQRYDYSEDILVSAELTQSEFVDEDFPEFIDATQSEEMVESINKWSVLDKSVLADQSTAPVATLPRPVFTQTQVRTKKPEQNDSDILRMSTSEYSSDFQDWEPVILSKPIARETASASTAAAGRTEVPSLIRELSIKQITRDGLVKLADGESHDYNTDDIVEFIGLQGENIPSMLINEKWSIDLNKSRTYEFILRGFEIPAKEPAPAVTAGKVRKVPDEFLGAIKTHRDTSRHSGDIHVPSQTQFKAIEQDYKNRNFVRQFKYKSIEDYTTDKNKVMIEALNTKVFIIASKTDPFRKLLANGRLSDEDLFEMIQALNTANPTVFGLLTVDELVKVLKFKLLNPSDNRNLRELFKSPLDLGLRDVMPLHERVESESKSTVHGTMIQAVNEWHDSMLGKKEDSGRSHRDNVESKRKGKRGGSNYEEKYLKYKTKYLELKTKLGL